VLTTAIQADERAPESSAHIAFNSPTDALKYHKPDRFYFS